MKTFSVILIFILNTNVILPQACCSAGSPLLGSLEVSSAQNKVLRLGLTYEYNFLDAVYSGTSDIHDNTRIRRVHAILLEADYGLTDKISLTTLLTFVNQRREIFSKAETQNSLSTLGISDAIIMAKYSLSSINLLNNKELSFGFGVKIPFGSASFKEDGILLPADMQPGTGAWDFIFSGYAGKSFWPKLPLNIFLSTSYRLNGTNKRFGDNFNGYSFGNEVIANLGLGYRTNTIFDFSLILRYRNTLPDKFNKEEVSNTGGNWIYFLSGVNANINDRLTFRVSGSLPLYRNLTGTQLTTTFTTGFTIFYTFGNI